MDIIIPIENRHIIGGVKVGGNFGRTYSRIKSSRNINPGNEKPGNDFSSLGSDFNVTIIALEPALDELDRYLAEIDRFLTGWCHLVVKNHRF